MITQIERREAKRSDYKKGKRFRLCSHHQSQKRYSASPFGSSHQNGPKRPLYIGFPVNYPEKNTMGREPRLYMDTIRNFPSPSQYFMSSLHRNDMVPIVTPVSNISKVLGQAKNSEKFQKFQINSRSMAKYYARI